MGPVAKPVVAKKPRGSVLFYDGEMEKGAGKPRSAKDDILGNNTGASQKGGVQTNLQPSSTSSAKAVAKSRPNRTIRTMFSSSARIGVSDRSSFLAPPLKNASPNRFPKPGPIPLQPDGIEAPSIGSDVVSVSDHLRPLLPQRFISESLSSNPASSYCSESEISSEQTHDVPSLATKDTAHLNLQTNANAQVVLSLTKDVLEAFSEVPYVKVIVGVALKIIEISDNMKTNKERCAELVEKVLSFSQVVFEALLAFDGKESLDTSGIKDDLLQIQKVFESVYKFLNDLNNSGMRSRLRGAINRDEIAQRISEQDRRLDNAIAMFQFKSIIKLRKGVDFSNLADRNIARFDSRSSGPSRKSFTHKPRPQIFFGRSSEIQAIYGHLRDYFQTKSPTRLCILGPGGIGKTSLALTIFHHDEIRVKFKEDRYFISCEAIPSADLLLAELATTFTISMEGDILRTLLLHLQNNPCLLVLDNFETVWDPSDGRSQVESLLTEITSIDTVTLIITMRGSQRPSGTRWSEVIPPLKPIDINSAMAIFKAISRKSDEYARRLIEAVDCMPLAVTLLATLASVDGESTEGLWLRWQQESTSMVEQGGGRLNNLEKSIQLSISSPRMQSDRGALIFLGVLSMLPDGMSPDTMKVCEAYFPDGVMVHKAVSTLRQNALIYEDTASNIRVLNPIRLFIRKQHRASIKAQAFLYGCFISLALQGTLYTDPIIRFRLEKEAGNINAILLEALESATFQDLTEVVQATISFSHYAYVSGKGSTQAISRAIDKLEASKMPHKLKPKLTEALGTTKATPGRGLSGRLQLPLPYFVKTRAELVKDKLESDVDPTLKLRADCLGCLGQLLSQQSKFVLAEEKFRLAKNLHVQAGDIGGYAYDTLNLGLLMSQTEKSSENALEYFKQAVALHEKIDDLSGKAYDLLAAGGTLRELYRFSESDAMFSNAASIFSDLKDTSGQATALNGLGTVMLSRSRLPQAERHFSDAAKLSADVGDIIGQAESVSGLAIVSLLLSRLPEAQIRIEQSISLRDPYEDPDYLHILGRIHIGKEDWNQAESVLSRALAIHRDIGDSRGEADDLCYLASIQYSRGNFSIMQDLACRALVKSAGKATTAQIKALFSLALIYRSLFHAAKRELEWCLAVYEEIEDIMGQAHILYLTGIYYVHLGDFEEATTVLERALKLHTQVGHLKGKADVLCLIAYIQAVQDLLQEATDIIKKSMPIHIDIGNKSGQGNDLYVQAIIYLLQHRYGDAYRAIKSALKLHETSESKYGKARDLVMLSKILWGQQHDRTPITRSSLDDQPHRRIDEGDMIAKSFICLEEGIGLFKELGCLREMTNCIEQKREMATNQTGWKFNIVI